VQMPTDEPLAPPLRTCPSCGQTAQTRLERCPHCQRSYYAPTRAQRRRRRVIAGGGAAAVAVAIAVGALLVLHDHQRHVDRTRAAQARTIAALRAHIRRVQAPKHGADRALKPAIGATAAQRLAARRALVVAVQRQITTDAQARAAAGEIDGPIRSTTCGPILKSKTAIPDDRVLSKHIGRYDCVAIKRHVLASASEKVAELGFAFVAALNFDTYTYTWCRNTPAQGEAGVALVFVRLERACLAATGKVMGTGYVASTDPNR
jgi:hypothetical protein